MEEVAPCRFVGHADSETKAREWLHTYRDDWELAIVDLFLADGSGFGVLRDCQSRKPSQKVVILTSYSHDNIASRCLQLGADRVFDKSSDIDKLVAYCKSHATGLGWKDPTSPPSAHLLHSFPRLH